MGGAVEGAGAEAAGPDGGEGAGATAEVGARRAASGEVEASVVGRVPAVALAVAPEVLPGPAEEAVRGVLLAGEDARADAEGPVGGANVVVPAAGTAGCHLAPAAQDEAAGGAARRPTEEAVAAGQALGGVAGVP